MYIKIKKKNKKDFELNLTIDNVTEWYVINTAIKLWLKLTYNANKPFTNYWLDSQKYMLFRCFVVVASP